MFSTIKLLFIEDNYWLPFQVFHVRATNKSQQYKYKIGTDGVSAMGKDQMVE